ncbi:MAG: Fic family protein [Candidatus Schekmanbacteria bacterium]|nr:Fic family protein [Candidatus Schekmanbacteria bacterium]
MKKTNKYDTSDLIEAQFEPGSRGRVLKNLFGIKSKREMDRIEFREYVHALEKLISIYEQDQRLTADDVCKIHKLWLGSVYEWAGQYRSVNASKEGFMFAAAAHIAGLMSDFEKGPLYQFTPCVFESRDEITRALAVVHTELIMDSSLSGRKR